MPEKMNFFIVGVIGAFVAYLVNYRINILETGRRNHFGMRSFMWGLLIMMLAGGLYTVFVMEPSTQKQAFLSGLTAEGFLIGHLRGKNKEGDNE